MFVSGDDFTELFLQHSGLQEILKNVKNNVRNGKMYDSEGYSLGGIEGVGKYILDYSTLLTFGNIGNLAVTYLGSYNLNWTVISKTDKIAIVLCEVDNSSTLQSGTRPPIIGYTSVWQNTVGAFENSLVKTGPLSQTTQKIIWTETISLD